jgi:hypothetical protein
MPRGNPSPKLAITVDPEIYGGVLSAATNERVSISAWMSAAAREALLRRAGLAAGEQWEKEHGRFSGFEIDEARRRVRKQLQSTAKARRSA